MYKRKGLIHYIITLIPFFMLIVTGLSGYLSHKDVYLKVFPYLGDILGYSILTNIVFGFLYFRKKFCMATKFCVIGLLGMNLISILFKGKGWIYNDIYDLWISLFIFCVCILTLARWR